MIIRKWGLKVIWLNVPEARVILAAQPQPGWALQGEPEAAYVLRHPHIPEEPSASQRRAITTEED